MGSVVNSLTPNIGAPPIRSPWTTDSNGLLNSLGWIKWLGLVGKGAQAAYEETLQSPLDFGAAGDGETDDTLPVQTAAEDLGYLWLPAGYTFATGTITITQSFFSIFGGGTLMLAAGKGTDLLVLDGTQYDGVVYPGNGLYAQITGVALLGNAPNQPAATANGNCLRLRNAAYTVVERCLIYGAAANGIQVENYNGSPNADEINIISNFIFANSQNGIRLLPVTDTSPPAWFHISDHVIVGNHINYNGNCGIWGTWLTSNLIANNNVLTNGTGMFFDAADRLVLSGNACRNNKGSGIVIDQDHSGNGFGRAKACMLVGNQLHFNGVEAEGDELDIFNADGMVVDANMLGDTDFDPPVAQYGIQLFNCTGIVLKGNNFQPTLHGALLAPIVDGRQQPYRSLGNINLADGMQANQANLPLPAANDYGLLCTVVDYQHVLLWIGDQWVAAVPGDCNQGITGADNSGALANGVWAFCDGSKATCLNPDGTLATKTTPDNRTLGNGQWYMRR